MFRQSSSQIREACLSEHTALIETGEQALEYLRNAPDYLESTLSDDHQFAQCLVLQAYSLEAASTLAISGHYREAYNTLRMVFEGYWLLRLVGTCHVVADEHEVGRLPSDRSIEAAKKRYAKEAREILGRDLVRIETGKDSLLTIVRKGNRFKDADGNLSPRMISPYWLPWKSYRGGHFLAKKKLKTKRFLQGQWAIDRSQPDSKFEEYNRTLYTKFFAFAPLLDTLRLNRVLTMKTTTRVLVHYNFLSSFTHSNYEALGRLVQSRTFNEFEGLEYDHYHSELALLYAAHLATMSLDLLLVYGRNPGITVKDAQDLDEAINGTEEKFGYFWFIFNQPHQWDRFEYANRKSNYDKGIYVTPSDVQDRYVRYYDDPYARLKALHSSNTEMTSRNQFVSPFSRRDAFP